LSIEKRKSELSNRRILTLTHGWRENCLNLQPKPGFDGKVEVTDQETTNAVVEEIKPARFIVQEFIAGKKRYPVPPLSPANCSRTPRAS
jgi:hypothetical protein